MGDSRDYSDKTETTDLSGSSSRSPGSLKNEEHSQELFLVARPRSEYRRDLRVSGEDIGLTPRPDLP